jgi:hypothetical protein
MKTDDHRFTGKGLGTTTDTRPICAKFPPDVERILRSLPDRSEFIRAAVIAALEEQGLLFVTLAKKS